MPTELPYAADAEVSLSYDELEVILWTTGDGVSIIIDAGLGPPSAIREGAFSVARHGPVKVQLRLGTRQESQAGTPSRRRAAVTRQVSFLFASRNS